MGLGQALEIVRLTDVGRLRHHNEDAIASDDSIGLVILADGMGGYNAGEVASEIAVLSITAELKEALGCRVSKHTLFDDDCFFIDHNVIRKLLVDAVATANASIYFASHTYPQCAGMGTTLALGLFVDRKLFVGHVGDSRVYRLRNQRLAQITEDHSLLQDEIKAGLLNAAQVKHYAHKNLVTRAMGVYAEVALELNEFAVEVGDVYLLCSDGLSDLVDDTLMQTTLNLYMFDLTSAASALVALANDHGGRDNISVILAKVNHTNEDVQVRHDNFLAWLK